MAVRVHFMVLIVFLGLATAWFDIGPVGAKADPDPLQDFCVADLQAPGPSVNGYPCRAADQLTEADFAYAGLATAANLTGFPTEAMATLAFVDEWPALNTLGLSLVRLDINPGGVILPHTHHLATEILYCLEGEVYTGFVTNGDNPTVPNKLYAKIVKAGEAFIFPRGLLHFQLNKGTKPVVTINVLNSQKPGIQLMPKALFGVGIDPELLAKSFFISEALVANISAPFANFG